MRRIYESDALHRDDDEPHAPRERTRHVRLQAMRSVPATTLSRALLPRWLRHRCLTVDVRTRSDTYVAGEPIPFTVIMRNVAPIPISVTTTSPLYWEWTIDGLPEASQVPHCDPPAEPGRFEFDRGERKTFERRWTQSVRTGSRSWEPVEPGRYRIGATINVADPSAAGLQDETTVEIVPE